MNAEKLISKCKKMKALAFIFRETICHLANAILDRHYVWWSHDPMSGIWPIFFKGLIVFRLPLYGVFHFCIFFFLRLFF